MNKKIQDQDPNVIKVSMFKTFNFSALKQEA